MFVCLLVLFCFVLFLSAVFGAQHDSISNIYQTSKPVMYVVYVVTLVSWHGHRRARKKKKKKQLFRFVFPLWMWWNWVRSALLIFKTKDISSWFFNFVCVCVASLLCSLFCFQPSPFTSKCFHTLCYRFGEGGGGIILFLFRTNWIACTVLVLLQCLYCFIYCMILKELGVGICD